MEVRLQGAVMSVSEMTEWQWCFLQNMRCVWLFDGAIEMVKGMLCLCHNFCVSLRCFKNSGE